MIQRALASKDLVAYVLACATGITLYFRWPFPENDLMLHLISIRAPLIYAGFKCTYTLFLFTTPYIAYSLILSGLYVFAFRPTRKLKPMPLPAYPDPSGRDELFLVLGEVHDPRTPVPAAHPYWLTVPERGLFTGIAIFGAIGTGKTSGCMYPYAEQLIAYRRDDPDKRIGGLVLEVKGDFCHKVKDILKRHRREDDYVEVNLNADYRYNPLYNDLDAYALAYNIASLLNNLFGKGKEPFWQQAYTNLAKFIIQLHKVAYDYVTLFDVYECAINPELLETRIKEAEHRLTGCHYLILADADFRAHPDLERFHFVAHEPGKSHKAPQSPPLEEALKSAHLEYEPHFGPPLQDTDPLKLEILEGVKRWFYNDWRRIENKLRTSIVEGISVFLSLFDDNPMVKRAFCPPKECYDPKLNVDGEYGRPLTSLYTYLAAFSVTLLVAMLAVDPELARERAHLGSDSSTSNLRFASGFFFLMTLISASFLVGRTHTLIVPSAMRWIALAIFMSSSSVQTWAMIANPFFSPAVRIQSNRNHVVINSGPYRFIRHPGYFAMCISIPASALAIGSWLALIPAGAFIAVIGVRAKLEEEFLKANLPGYARYAKTVRSGMFHSRST